jgi:hypothetical protein
MKKILLSCMLFLVVGIWAVFSYDLTESDNILLDRVEEQIMDIIDDESNNLSAEVFISYIEKALNTRDLTDKQETLLQVIADDISYYYYLWEYAGDLWNMLASDCYADEYYDEQDEMCYYRESENYDDESNYEYGEFSGGEQEQESEILAEYSISGNIITLESGDDGIKNREVWNIFTSLIPENARRDFSLYQITNDAAWDTAAHVVQSEQDNTKWILNINLDAFYIDGVLEPEESYATLIHEFAHVMTLWKDQMRYYPITDNQALLDRFSQNCVNQLLQEWCMNRDSYLDDFIDIFWSDSDYLKRVRNQEVYAYDDTPERFITEYAATNPGEDIAESFTYFVLNGKTSWSSITDQKLNFFYSYRELDSLRKQIRSRLAELK